MAKDKNSQNDLQSGERIVIRASEISDYLFCPRAWYLKRYAGVRVETESLREGERLHEIATSSAAETEKLERSAKILLLLGLLGLISLLVVIWILLA